MPKTALTRGAGAFAVDRQWCGRLSHSITNRLPKRLPNARAMRAPV